MRYYWQAFNCLLFKATWSTTPVFSGPSGLLWRCGDYSKNNISSRGKPNGEPNRWSLTHLINIHTVLHFSSYVLQTYVNGSQKDDHKCCHFVPSSLYQWHYAWGWQLWANPFRSLLVNSEPSRLCPEQLRFEAKEQSWFCKCCWQKNQIKHAD